MKGLLWTETSLLSSPRSQKQCFKFPEGLKTTTKSGGGGNCRVIPTNWRPRVFPPPNFPRSASESGYSQASTHKSILSSSFIRPLADPFYSLLSVTSHIKYPQLSPLLHSQISPNYLEELLGAYQVQHEFSGTMQEGGKWPPTYPNPSVISLPSAF